MERTSSIYNDKTAVEGIKENSRDKYIKAWISFKLFSDMNAGVLRKDFLEIYP